MADRAEEFLSEIRDLMSRYGATLDEGEDYDGKEEYRGSRLYVVVAGERYQLSDLMPQKADAGKVNHHARGRVKR